MKTIRWGILGCGKIARKFAADLALVSGSELTAVASRDYATAAAFAAEFPSKHILGSYEALVSHPEVDVIYIATPHGFHHEHAILCMKHGKHVLCEKAFALNTRQVKEMIEVAKEEKVFLMEALWSKFLPHYKKLMEFIREGKLGELKNVLINFGFATPVPTPARMYDPKLGGGSLLDIGIYNIFFAMSVLGKPDIIEASMTAASTGVDEQCSMAFRYKNGAIAQLLSSFSTNLATEADISGTQGRIRLKTRFYEPSTTFAYYPGRVDSETIIPIEKSIGWGYSYEIAHVNDCLRAGLVESPVMTWKDSVELMEVMDEVRRKAGIVYEVD